MCIINTEINYQLSFIFTLHNSALVDIIHTFHYLADLRKSLSAGHKTVLELLSRLIFFAIYTSITVGYDWQAAALTEGDPDGCVIDGTTAWELFGNKVPGGQILFQGRTYTVRKVADWGQKILVFGAASADDTETELFYNRLFIRRRNGETEESTVNGFLMKYGLQGTVVSSALPKNAGLAALLLLPAVLSGSLWTEISREKKNYTVKDTEYWFCNLLYSVMAGTVVWLLFTHLTWPEGWIPSRWSDFGFWKDKVDQAVAEFKLYLMLPQTVSQTEGMILGGKTVCAGGGSCFLYLLWKVFI